jgi:hypothetical protein
VAQRVAEAVDQTWHRAPPAVSSRIEVPVSVVAALSLLALPDPDDTAELTRRLRTMPARVFAGMLRDLWRSYVNLRPDLTPRAYPLFSWLFTDDLPDPVAEAAQHTAHAALGAGQLQVTGTDARHEVDLLGMVLTELRSDSARKGHAQVYTPPDLAQLIADMLRVDQLTKDQPTRDQDARDQPARDQDDGDQAAEDQAGDQAAEDRAGAGATVHEPAAGTGGMLRAVAQSMRRAGRDPAAVRWVAVDIDEMAIACLAVNAHLWGLGPLVLLGVGNTLTDDWQARAEGERRECVELAASVRHYKTMAGLLRTANALVDAASAEQRQDAARAGEPRPTEGG